MAPHHNYFFSVTIDGQEYPAALTNGALLRFSELTGHDFGHDSDNLMRDNVAIVYACIESGCRRQGKPFDMTLLDFADATTPAELANFAAAMQAITDNANVGTLHGASDPSAPAKAKKKALASSTSKA